MQYKIKLSKRHPAQKMNLGKHKITSIEQIFDLTEVEEKILNTDEAKYWFVVNKIKQEKKNKTDLDNIEIDISSDEPIDNIGV